MSVVIRMQRNGSKKNPIYTIVAAHKEFARNGRYLEKLGQYRPKAQDPNDKVNLDLEKLQQWQKRGALLSETVGQLVKIASK